MFDISFFIQLCQMFTQLDNSGMTSIDITNASLAETFTLSDTDGTIIEFCPFKGTDYVSINIEYYQDGRHQAYWTILKRESARTVYRKASQEQQSFI